MLIMHKAGHAYSSGHLMQSLINSVFSLAMYLYAMNIRKVRKEPCGRWMIVIMVNMPLFMARYSGQN